MRIRILRPAVMAVLSLLALSGCANLSFNPDDPGQRALGGAVIGAGTGAAIGGAIGGWEGAGIGAATGGVVGAITGAATTPGSPTQASVYSPYPAPMQQH
jgi:hypothetical protein